jgi:hypothetical protein
VKSNIMFHGDFQPKIHNTICSCLAQSLKTVSHPGPRHMHLSAVYFQSTVVAGTVFLLIMRDDLDSVVSEARKWPAHCYISGPKNTKYIDWYSIMVVLVVVGITKVSCIRLPDSGMIALPYTNVDPPANSNCCIFPLVISPSPLSGSSLHRAAARRLAQC